MPLLFILFRLRRVLYEIWKITKNECVVVHKNELPLHQVRRKISRDPYL